MRQVILSTFRTDKTVEFCGWQILMRGFSTANMTKYGVGATKRFAEKHPMIAKIGYFFATSGVGLVISLCAFAAIINSLRINVFLANLFADMVALLWVFCLSWIFIFDHDGRRFTTKFLVILTLRIISVIVFSYFIDHATLLAEGLFMRMGYLPSHQLVATATKFASAPLSVGVNFYLTYIVLEKLAQRRPSSGKEG